MRAMFFKMQIFRFEKRYRFFPSQNIYFYDLEWSPQKRHNHRIMSQNDCIMSVLTMCNLLCMREIALVVGAVLITFFWQNTSDINLTDKNEFTLIRGVPQGI